MEFWRLDPGYQIGVDKHAENIVRTIKHQVFDIGQNDDFLFRGGCGYKNCDIDNYWK